MAPSNTSHRRVTGTIHRVNLGLTLRWMIPSHLMLAPRTTPGGCLWTLAIAAVRPRNLSLPAPRLRACIFHSHQTRWVMIARRRCKPMTRIPCNINAVTRYPCLGHFHYSYRAASVKTVSPLRLVSCPPTIPTCPLVFLPTELRPSNPVRVHCLIRS